MSDNELLPSGPESSSAGGEVTPRRARTLKRSRSRTALIVAGALVLLIGVGGVGAVLAFQKSLENNLEKLADPFEAIDNRPLPVPSDPDIANEAVNILVLGSDSRISAGDPTQWSAGAQRTDSIMLVHLPADRESAQVVSFPRDSWVSIPGHGEAKINAAFSYGGPSLRSEERRVGNECPV